MQVSIAEYIWLNSHQSAPQFSSGTRFVVTPKNAEESDFPVIHYQQAAAGDAGQTIVQPVRLYPDPFRGEGHYIVLCEAHQVDGGGLHTNHRARLRQLLRKYADISEPWFSFEQHYNLACHGWPQNSGNLSREKLFSRELAEAHSVVCMAAGVLIHGVTYNSANGKGEFQIGYRGIEDEQCDALKVTDDLWLARYLLQRICEQYSMQAAGSAVVECDYTDTDLFTCFSTRKMREQNHGLHAIQRVVALLQNQYTAEHHQYIQALTGTESSSRMLVPGSVVNPLAVRIPQPVAEQGYGYLEEQRCGHTDPYRIGTGLLSAAQR